MNDPKLNLKHSEIATRISEWTVALHAVAVQYDHILTEIQDIKKGTDEIGRCLVEFHDDD